MINFLKPSRMSFFVGVAIVCFVACTSEKNIPTLFNAENFQHYVDYFNRMEDENIVQAIPNEKSWEWMKENIPLFECPQDNFEEMYYYRWWTLRKHIKQTPVGYVMTEFLVDRPYADKYNMIACAMGHHIMESRWLHNPVFLNEYLHVWFRGNNGQPMEKVNAFSNWTTDALWQKYLVDGDKDYMLDLLPDMVEDYKRWEANRRHDNGLFWQRDVQDGMEEQISGGRRVKNARPTINSYMHANATAIAKMAAMTGNAELEALYSAKADTLYSLIHTKLWNPESEFFETVLENGEFAKVREAIGFIPWYFDIPTENQLVAWKQLMDEHGFLAPYGQTTAERRHPLFRTHGCCRCEWDGAVWPFATSQTLTGLANLLGASQQNIVSKDDYFRHLELYVESQYHRGRPYIGEYLDEVTGYWLKGDQERSRYYNHSTFNDLIITGLVGFRPREDNVIEVNPLLPDGRWDWFSLDNLLYKGNVVTIIWDKDGTRYNKGQGFQVLVNGKKVASSEKLERIISNDVEFKQAKEEEIQVVVPLDLKWSERMAMSQMKRSPELYRSWGYMQGLVLTAFEELWITTGEKKYQDYINEYAGDLIDHDGTIKRFEFDSYNIDNINAGKILFNLYEVTGEERFRVACETLRRQLQWQPRTSEGGYWHKLKYTWQMWLDGAYMGAPFLARYAAEYNESESFDEVVLQILLMDKYLHDAQTDLLYHGWDEARVQNWADPETGRSSNFWGRAIGWYVMAIVDVLEYLPESHVKRGQLIQILNRTMQALVKYQDAETGLWYQVVDKGNKGNNYLESSSSSMFVYVMAKGMNHNYLSEEFRISAEMGFEGILKHFIEVMPDGEVQLHQACRVAGLSADRDGSFEYYVSEPVQSNDLKAIGPFILACIELER